MTNYTSSQLFSLANQIRKNEGISQKDAFAKAKIQLSTPVKKGRGIYVRDDKWKANHGVKMKAFWAEWRANK